MLNNTHGEAMNFEYSRPHVTKADTDELGRLLGKAANPFEIDHVDVLNGLSIIGKHLVGGYDIPPETTSWWENIDAPMKWLADCTTQAVLANAYYLHAKQVDRATFARVALKWFEWFAS